MSKWKYNLKVHLVDEQPTMGKPDRYSSEQGHTLHDGFNEGIFNSYISKYNEHIKSLRHIPVSGEVDWKDGEDVTGKFYFKFSIEYGDGKFTPNNVAIPIKQEQEAIEDAERFVEENFKGLRDFIEDEDILIWYKALIVSAITDYQYKPKQEAIEDIDLRKFAYEQFKKEGWLNPSEAAIDYFIEGYKAALLSQQQPEHTSSEIITAQVHEIDSLRIANRELWEKLESDKLILIEKIQEQEIEIASLKNKIKELQSDYMAVQTEIQSNEK